MLSDQNLDVRHKVRRRTSGVGGGGFWWAGGCVDGGVESAKSSSDARGGEPAGGFGSFPALPVKLR